jgi:hypothetical protein
MLRCGTQLKLSHAIPTEQTTTLTYLQRLTAQRKGVLEIAPLLKSQIPLVALYADLHKSAF